MSGRAIRASREEREEFIELFLDQYEDLMDEYFQSSTSTADFERKHDQVKSKIVTEIQGKWENKFHGKRMSSSITTKVAEAIDKAFRRLKRHFEQSTSRKQNHGPQQISKENAIKYYLSEMEKYLEGTEGANRNGLTNAHDVASKAATKMVKESEGASVTSVTDLKAEMEECLEKFKTRLNMDSNATSDPTIGIDLGTTMCCVMAYYNGKVELIPNRAQGNSRTTPSYVAYFEDGSDTFGSGAKEEAYRYPENTIYDAKRMIGRPWSDKELQNDRTHWPFVVVKDKDTPKIKTCGHSRYPHEVSARLLAQFRLMADEHLELPLGTITKAVIAVPAYFTEPQRRATSEAAECAGLEVLKILSEPTAAAISYNWERRNRNETRKALIYDLGGGTFDVAVAIVRPDNVEILAVDGDTHLGGQDFDQLLMNHCIEEFKTTEGIDLSELKCSTEKQICDGVRTALARLKFQCERAKERLSTSSKTTINVEMFYSGKHLTVTVTKDKLEKLIKPLIKKTIDIVARVMSEVESKGIKDNSEIDDLILVGGCTRVPLVGNMLSGYFNGKPLCKHINPDEAVAIGAAIQAAISNNVGMSKPIRVQDVTPMTLGVNTLGHIFCRIIPRNSPVPCEMSTDLVSAVDNVTVMRCAIFQGEHDMARENNFLGKFRLVGLPPKPAGEQNVLVTMTIDSNGLLHVKAHSFSTGKSKGITITTDRLGIEKDKIAGISKEVDGKARSHFTDANN